MNNLYSVLINEIIKLSDFPELAIVRHVNLECQKFTDIHIKKNKFEKKIIPYSLYYLKKKFSIFYDTVEFDTYNIVEADNYNCIKYLIKHKYLPLPLVTDRYFNVIVTNGNLKLIKLYYNYRPHNVIDNESAYIFALKSNKINCNTKLKIIKWLRQQGFKWNSLVFSIAAALGYLKIMKWLRFGSRRWLFFSDSCPWSEQTFLNAVSYGNSKNINWLIKNGCPTVLLGPGQKGNVGPPGLTGYIGETGSIGPIGPTGFRY
jgi:hypothetical protein